MSRVRISLYRNRLPKLVKPVGDPDQSFSLAKRHIKNSQLTSHLQSMMF